MASFCRSATVPGTISPWRGWNCQRASKACVSGANTIAAWRRYNYQQVTQAAISLVLTSYDSRQTSCWDHHRLPEVWEPWSLGMASIRSWSKWSFLKLCKLWPLEMDLRKVPRFLEVFLKLMPCGAAVLLLFGYAWIVLLYLQKYVRETPMSLGKRSKAIVLHTISHYITWIRAELQHSGTVSLGMHNVLLPSNLRSLIFGSASDPMWRCLAEVPTICGWDMLKYLTRKEHNFCRSQWYPISVCQVTKWCFCASMLSGLSHVTLPSNLQSLAWKAPHCHGYGFVWK